MKTPKEKQVWNYLLNDLSKTQPNGHAICPYVGKYLNRIAVHEVTTGIKKPIYEACKELDEQKLMAVVLAYSNTNLRHHVIKSAAEEVLQDPLFEHIHILTLNHRLTGKVNGVFTGFRHCDLVVIQRTKQLEMARIQLKKTGYYSSN
jgi:hypothetical protein